MRPFDLLKTVHTMLDFGDADAQRLVAMGKLLLPHSAAMAALFYKGLDTSEVSKAILDADPGRRSKLHQTLAEWYAQIFAGKYDEAYAQRRWIIGLVHVRLAIPPLFVVGSMENVYRFSAHKLDELSSQLSGSLKDNLESLTKMLATDLAFIEQSYAQSTLRAMANEMGADEQLFNRFMHKGAEGLLAEARAGKF
jgi:hypothetical protein